MKRRRLYSDQPLRFHDAWEEIYRVLAKYPTLRLDLENALDIKMAASSVQRGLQWLHAFENRFLKINTAYLTVESHDQAIVDACETLARRVNRAFSEDLGKLKHQEKRSARYRQHVGVSLVKTICAGMDIRCPPVPPPEKLNADSIIAAVARLCDPKWWRRQVRSLQARKLEAANRYLGAVCKKRGGYCSDATLRRHNAQKRRNRDLLENLEAINDEGQRYTLAELSDLGVSNPVNRRNELMTRIRGCEEYAAQNTGMVPVFITQTCPARFHSHNRNGTPYDRWNRTTPREANTYLNEVWAKVRAKWNREGTGCFGFRVTEPHHDGCPHWHLLLWFPEDKVDRALEIYRDYALTDSPEEPGAQERRLTVKRDELAKGATGYIAKYISKNVDGLNCEGNAWSLDSVKTALRTEAWSRTWGIRQFQPIGNPSVTVYRECRRLTPDQLHEKEAPSELKQTLYALREAADQGDWCRFMTLMGGACVPLENQPVRAYMVTKKDETGNDQINRYGEVVEQLKGIIAFRAVSVITRIYDWVIQPVDRADTDSEEASLEYAAHAPPLVLCQ